MSVKVLVVDDVGFMRNIVVRALNEQGLRVIPAEDATEALAAFNGHRDISAVVTDLEMPGMDGKELFAKCKANFGDATPPFILLTATTSVESLIQAKREGFADVLTKPLDIDRLMKSLQAVLPEELRDQIHTQDSNTEPAHAEEPSVEIEAAENAREDEEKRDAGTADEPSPVAESEEEPKA